MNRKAQVGVGTLIMVFVAVFVGLILFEAIADQAAVTSLTKTYNDTLDQSTTTVPAEGTAIDLTGQSLLSTPIVIFANGTGAVPTGNYTITEGVSTSTGLKTIQYIAETDDIPDQEINISYDYGVQGYVDDAGARAIIPLIAIFFALAILVVVLYPIMKEKFM